ncbi:MAG: hypothetical protein ACK4TC_06150 [Sphingomonas pseudosanguinis]|uniref:hypothetical protein n=1 Tax=Sphingomonas pseudosanguinis TaxID=413712 RepID=UPI00391D0FD2
MLAEPGTLTVSAYAIVGLDEHGIDRVQGIAIGHAAADYALCEIRADAIEAIEVDGSMPVAQAEAIAASIRLLPAMVTFNPDKQWSTARA